MAQKVLVRNAVLCEFFFAERVEDVDSPLSIVGSINAVSVHGHSRVWDRCTRVEEGFFDDRFGHFERLNLFFQVRRSDELAVCEHGQAEQSNDGTDDDGGVLSVYGHEVSERSEGGCGGTMIREGHESAGTASRIAETAFIHNEGLLFLVLNREVV